MRRFMVLLSALVFASFLISFAALSAGAQTDTSDQYASEDPPPEEGADVAPEETSDGSEPYHQVVDNGAEGRFAAPGWQVGPGDDGTFGGDYAYTDALDAGPARYTVDIPEAGNYAVFARWPGGEDVTTGARFGVESVSGLAWDDVDQRTDAGLWIMIGAYEMEQGQREIQITGSPSADGRLVADAVMVVGDALIGPDGQTASSANPEELAGEPTTASGDRAFSAGRRGSDGRDVVRKARRYLGVNYKWGVCDPMRVMSCTCLTKKTYAKFGRKLPMTEKGQWRAEPSRKISRSKLKPGDEVFFKENGRRGPITHVGIYSGNGRLVHASNWCDDVCIGEMRYQTGYFGAKRYPLR